MLRTMQAHAPPQKSSRAREHAQRNARIFAFSEFQNFRKNARREHMQHAPDAPVGGMVALRTSFVSPVNFAKISNTAHGVGVHPWSRKPKNREKTRKSRQRSARK